MSTNNPYEAPLADVANASNTPYQPKIFTAKGRIGRLRYLAYGLLSYLVVLPIFGVIVALLGGGSAETGGALSGIGTLVGLIAYFFIFVYAFMLAKRRFNDLGQSGWLSLLLIVPFVNLIVGLFLIFAPGKALANAYGPPPTKNSIWVIIGALIFPILMLGVFAAVVLPAYSDYVERAQQAELNLSE